MVLAAWSATAELQEIFLFVPYCFHHPLCLIDSTCRRQNPFGLLRFFQKTTGFSADGSGLSWNKRLCPVNGQPLHKPAKFLQRKLFQLCLVLWPLEPLFRQALVQQDISHVIPIQRLNAIRITDRAMSPPFLGRTGFVLVRPGRQFACACPYNCRQCSNSI